MSLVSWTSIRRPLDPIAGPRNPMVRLLCDTPPGDESPRLRYGRRGDRSPHRHFRTGHATFTASGSSVVWSLVIDTNRILCMPFILTLPCQGDTVGCLILFMLSIRWVNL